MSLIRGALLTGVFRTHLQLLAMSADDQRNTLIVEMTKHSNQPVTHFQPLNDFQLAGAGAAMVFLLNGGIRNADGTGEERDIGWTPLSHAKGLGLLTHDRRLNRIRHSRWGEVGQWRTCVVASVGARSHKAARSFPHTSSRE
jgi:hypothetical protein